MKRVSAILIMVLLTFGVNANVVFDLFNDASLYGYLDNNAGPLAYTNNTVVAEFTAFGGVMNRTASGFGVDAPGSADDTYLINVDETLQITFDQAVTITTLDFRNFETGEGINIIIGSVTNLIAYDDLDNKTSDYIENLSWAVSEGETVKFEVAGTTGAIAVDSITVVPEPATLALIGIGGLLALISQRLKR